MADNKFLIKKLTQANADQLSGWTILENERDQKTYKYPVSNLSSDIKNQTQAIVNGNAVHDYIDAISTSLSTKIRDSEKLLVDGKAVHDYINAISSSLSNDINSGGNKLVDGNAVYNFVLDFVKNKLDHEDWLFTTNNGSTGGNITKHVYLYNARIN